MESLKNKKVIVTGGTGFIGSHIVEELDNLGANVLVIDIVLNPNSYFALNNLQNKINLELVDIAQKNKIAKLFNVYKPDFVFHLAAEAIVNNSYNNPYKTFQTNIMGTVSILEAIRAINSVKGVIVASSDKAYGKTKKVYTEDSPLAGDHPYDVSKSATDLITQTYHNTFGLPTVITRFGNVYGEGDLNYSRIIPGIMQSIINNETLKIRSNGEYVRDYLYVKDVVKGYLKCALQIDISKGEAYNFGSFETLSVTQLISIIENSLHKKVKYQIMNTAKNEIPYQSLNFSKAKEHLKWTPSYDLNKTITKLFNFYEQVL